MTTLAGTPGTYGLADSPSGTSATFNQPIGITTDGTCIYVADYRNNMIRKVDIATGAVSRLAGSSLGIAGYANSTDGTGNSATFNLPTAVTMHKDSIYVADTGNNSIRKIDISSGVVTLIAGSTTGVAGSIDALNGTDARFNQPTGITTDGTNLFVADSVNDTIRKIVISNGAVTTLAGSATIAGSADGIGTSATFNQPARITTDGSNLYVTDSRNHTIRKIVIATKTVTTLAGAAGAVGSINGTTGSEARFNQPNGITTDGSSLYVTDTFYNTIRKINISSGETSTLPFSFIKPGGITADGTSLFVTETYSVTTDSNNNPVYTYGNIIRKLFQR
jgi:sugar lactone lactonase YvrE